MILVLCKNCSASSPIEYVGYYAWGETEEKTTYNWSTYKWCNGSETTMTIYCTDSSYGIVDNKKQLDLSDDAVYVNWGSSWRMPTLDEIQELLNNTTSTWTSVNGVSSRRFTSKTNGNSIFLPAAGVASCTARGRAATTGRPRSSRATRTARTTSASARAARTGATTTAAAVSPSAPCVSTDRASFRHAPVPASPPSKVTPGGGAGLAKAREAPSGGVTFEGGKMGLERLGQEHPQQGVFGKAVPVFLF